MTRRTCTSCQQPRQLRDFDFGGAVTEICLECMGGRMRLSRAERSARIVSLESQRRSLIAALFKVDTEIATLRERPTPQPFVLDDSEIVETTFGEDDDDDDDRDRLADDVS